jgi:hypothetical protein
VNPQTFADETHLEGKTGLECKDSVVEPKAEQ